MRRRNETTGEIKGMRGDILEQGATWVKGGLWKRAWEHREMTQRDRGGLGEGSEEQKREGRFIFHLDILGT